jgi:UDP-glucose 4-epimerase
VGNNNDIAIYDLAVLIKRLTKSTSSFCYTPFEDAYSDEYLFIKERVPSLDKLRKYTQYKHQWSLERTLKHLIVHEQKLIKIHRLRYN